MPSTTARAVLYLRLSESDDASTSIARQEADLRARCPSSTRRPSALFAADRDGLASSQPAW